MRELDNVESIAAGMAYARVIAAFFTELVTELDDIGIATTLTVAFIRSAAPPALPEDA